MTAVLAIDDQDVVALRVAVAIRAFLQAFQLPAAQQPQHDGAQRDWLPGSNPFRFSLRSGHEAASASSDMVEQYARPVEKGFARVGKPSDSEICRTLADALRRSVAGLSCPMKRLARVSGRTERTAQNHLDGLHQMSANDLLRYIAEFDAVYEAVKHLSGRADVQLSERQRQAVVEALRILEGK